MKNDKTATAEKTAKTADVQKSATVTATPLKVVEDTKTEEKPTPTPPPPSVETVIEKTQNLAKLIEKRGRILSKKKELESFRLSGDSNTIGLLLEDGDGHSYQTNHTGAIQDIIAMLCSRATSELAKVDSEILNY